MIKSFNAFVIHKQWVGDTSARLFLFTEELGVFHCLCTGARTPKKQALIQSFTPLWVAVDERYDRFYTKSIEATAPTLPLHGPALFSALYLNELLYHVLKSSEPMPSLFHNYVFTLQELTQVHNQLSLEPLLRRFEWDLLHLCGYGFSFTEEARTGDVINAEYNYSWQAGEGFVVASQGIPGTHLLALAEGNLSEEAYLKSAKIIMRKAIDHLLGGREVKARALFK